MDKINLFIGDTLLKRAKNSLLRKLTNSENLIDFCSNDYLGFANNKTLKEKIQTQNSFIASPSGAAGSRLLAGNTLFAENLEQKIAQFHGFESGLLFNSGYDANVGLLSALLQKSNIVITDEYIHASTIDGIKMSHATRYKFKHNDLIDLEKKLILVPNTILVFVCVESVYSMDGDQAPLKELAILCKKYGAALIVDEAHALGVFGTKGEGLVHHYGLQNDIFACVVTFGKALGCHGAIVLGNDNLRNYLINFARSFIYSTALPMHSLICIDESYNHLNAAVFGNDALHHLIGFFGKEIKKRTNITYIESLSAIQCIVLSGNDFCKKIALKLQSEGYDIRAVLSPTVPSGLERLRICLHTYNTEQQITTILNIISKEIY